MSAQPPLLEVRNLRVWYPVRRGVLARTVDHVRAVDGVNLTLDPGETLGVVGESGCGKSTLARAILRLEQPRAGEILLDGRDVLRLRGRALQAYRRDVQAVFQDPLASLNPRQTILDQLTEGALVQGLLQPAAARAFARNLLQDVGLGPEALDRYPHAFSGGQRQRICIARALALNPRLLICDEAASALDLSVRAQVLNLLAELRSRRQLAYLFITHDIGVVQHIADRIAVMYLGKIVELGPAEIVLAAPAHPYTRLLLSSVPRVGNSRRAEVSMQKSAIRQTVGQSDSQAVQPPNNEERSHPPSAVLRPPTACPFAPRCPLAFDRCRQEAPELSPAGGVSAPHGAACFRSRPPDLRDR